MPPKTVYLATLHDESALHRGQPKNPERIITKMVSSSTTAQNMFNIWILYRLADSISNCPDLITIIYKLLTARLHPAKQNRGMSKNDEREKKRVSVLKPTCGIVEKHLSIMTIQPIFQLKMRPCQTQTNQREKNHRNYNPINGQNAYRT